ncbi:NO-binding membrane sensor protein with MHYT domain [Nocardia transvalensis]|uniref:NO-binding membrane sensor protein with MHYT domain n=1 Tax=Nocardia transvalensis TaxID=37333 RepID=A0A7W9UFI6_9NOCA|nr:MHYT domain-containing protein [Nocardia transvalensis]MBB5911147.1 NO-binding membrane sensor protein with MHYT domain [Nocardia transvalensis]
MLEIDHFTYGWLTPVAAYVMSVVGSLLALRCMVRARAGGGHGGWIATAAVALGGTGIWVMHFIAMLGFSVRTATIRYDIPLTLISAVIAMSVVWAGLSIVVRRPDSTAALLTGGTITGLGVGAMHYAGMWAMKTDVAVRYTAWVVLLSLIIAVVAATAALWFALHVRGIAATAGAALTMGVAVCGMHYTGMFAMHVQMGAHVHAPGGAQAHQLLTPLLIGVSMVTMLLLLQVGITDIDEPDLRRIQGQRASRYWPSRTHTSDTHPDDYGLPRHR